ncbi:MAG: efflux transporter outer membrane subunit [Burkholderiaceae bacterium]
MSRWGACLGGLAAACLLAACAAPGGPGETPRLDLPAQWTLEAPWQPGQPRDAVPKGPWWESFGDAKLNALQQQALRDNPGLAAAAGRLAQARAQVSAASAGLFPQLNLSGRGARQRISANRPLSNYNSPNFSTVQNDLTLGFSASYEVDLWGRVEQGIAGARASAEQSAADLENARLLLSAELAADYFNLRELDTELDVLARSIALQRKALDFVGARRELGAASGLELAQQQALLDTTLTQVELLRRQRAQFEHAIAALVGQPAPGFAIAADVRRFSLPEVPLGLPSELLQRRPDVASAQRAMAVANAQIGVARAAFYPGITLAPSYGVESRALASLFDAPSLLWSFGVSASQVLFDGGRLRANVDFARAGHEVAAANYRRVVLTAMQEVEDGISGVATLGRATAQADVAVASARRVLELANGRYEGGASTYLDVITAQQALLSSERQAEQLRGQSLLVSVYLIKALGGDW